MRTAVFCGVALLVIGCDDGRGGKVLEAKSRARDVAVWVERFRERYGRYPKVIEDLTESQRDGDKPLLPVETITDPWGKKFMFRVEVDGGGEHAVVYTVSPRGQAISGTADKR